MDRAYEDALEWFHDAISNVGSNFMSTLGKASKESAGLLGGPLGVYATEIAKIKGKREGDKRSATPVNPDLLNLYKPSGAQAVKPPRMYTGQEVSNEVDNAINSFRASQSGNVGGSSRNSSSKDDWADRASKMLEMLGIKKPSKGEAGKDYVEYIKGGDRTFSPYGEETTATKFGSAAAMEIFDKMFGDTSKEIPATITAEAHKMLAGTEEGKLGLEREFSPGRKAIQDEMLKELRRANPDSGSSLSEESSIRPPLFITPGNISTGQVSSMPLLPGQSLQDNYATVNEILREKKKRIFGGK